MTIEYVVVNGFIEDNTILMQDPFRSVGSITQLFKNNMEDARSIMNVIDQLKKNLEEII